jgi:hypothetical protein
MTNNPEFKRQLWLEWSSNKLILMPVLLALAFFTVTLVFSSETASALEKAALLGFFGLTLVWGTRNAQASVLDELREKTWDQQRMSALHPWTMTWGKLFGATSYAWFGGLICLAVYVFSAMALGHAEAIVWAIVCILAVISAHAITIAANLRIGQQDTPLLNRGGAIPLGLFSVYLVLSPLGILLVGGRADHQLAWWGLAFSQSGFALMTSILLVICSVVAAWRVMSESLSARTLPWAWPSLAIVLAIYIAGITTARVELIKTNPVHALCFIGCGIAVTMSYIAALSESNRLALWQSVRARVQSGNIRGALRLLPLWPTSLGVALAFAILMLIYSVISSQSDPKYTAMAIAYLLMSLRDIALLIFFQWRPSVRKPLGAFIVTMLVLYGLLPILLNTIGIKGFALPWKGYGEVEGWLSVAFAALQAAAACALTLWQARQAQQASPLRLAK